MLENCLVPADAGCAAQLGIEEGSQVIYISRLRLADGEPVAIENTYFPIKYAFLLNQRFDDNSLLNVLRENGRAEVVSSEKLIGLYKAAEGDICSK